MTRFTCGRWTPTGPCPGDLEPPGTCAACATRPHQEPGIDQLRQRRIDTARDARFGATPPRVTGCFERTLDDDWCTNEYCLSATRANLVGFAKDCGRVHANDLPPESTFEPKPAPWLRKQRRRWIEREAKASETHDHAARTLEDWIVETPKFSPDGRTMSPGTSPFKLPPSSGLTDETARLLVRVLTSVPDSRARTSELRGSAATRTAWYTHDGYGPDSEAGAVRHAVAELFPDAAPLRPGDRRGSAHDDIVQYLEGAYAEAQGTLKAWGLCSLTLYRGMSFGREDQALLPDQPVGRNIARALSNGDLEVERHGHGLGGFVRGEFPAPVVSSTVDGWAATREHAAGWAKRGPLSLSCILAAEIPAWSVLTWGRLAAGDSDHFGNEEVLVRGGGGDARWAVEGHLTHEQLEALGL